MLSNCISDRIFDQHICFEALWFLKLLGRPELVFLNTTGATPPQTPSVYKCFYKPIRVFTCLWGPRTVYACFYAVLFEFYYAPIRIFTSLWGITVFQIACLWVGPLQVRDNRLCTAKCWGGYDTQDPPFFSYVLGLGGSLGVLRHR